MSESEHDSGAERRTFFRVLTHLPVKCRRVSDAEAEALERALPQRRAPDMSRVDEALATWLDRIERKLDRVLVHLGIGDPVAFCEADVQEVMDGLEAKGITTPHDHVVGGQLARILCGGDRPAGTPVTEDEVFALEREAFLHLAGTEATRARIRHMLEHGRPLRN